MGLIVSKVALVLMLKNYRFEATSKKPIEFLSTGVTMIPKGGINLRITRRICNKEK